MSERRRGLMGDRRRGLMGERRRSLVVVGITTSATGFPIAVRHQPGPALHAL